MPFRNLKFFVMLNKGFGLISCKLVKGQLKSSSIWSYCYCIVWFLFNCFSAGVKTYILSVTYINIKDCALSSLRANLFFLSLLPYNIVSIFWSKDIVTLSEKLLTYDEQAIRLGHQRTDKHIVIYIFFVYTLIVISWKAYYLINDSIPQGLIMILSAVIIDIVSIFCGTYCIFITTIFLDLIRQRFYHLNEKIIPHVSELRETKTQGKITVYDVRYLHGVLFDCANLINTLYGLGALITFLSILIELVWNIYLCIKDFQNSNEIIDNLAQMLDLSFQTIYFFAMYHFTAYEANRVEECVIKYGLAFSNKKYRLDKIEMLLYFYHRRYSFTAAEFFPLNLMILLPTATAVITYLTLIV